jgi:hypothetical protein
MLSAPRKPSYRARARGSPEMLFSSSLRLVFAVSLSSCAHVPLPLHRAVHGPDPCLTFRHGVDRRQSWTLRHGSWRGGRSSGHVIAQTVNFACGWLQVQGSQEQPRRVVVARGTRSRVVVRDVVQVERRSVGGETATTGGCKW